MTFTTTSGDRPEGAGGPEVDVPNATLHQPFPHHTQDAVVVQVVPLAGAQLDRDAAAESDLQAGGAETRAAGKELKDRGTWFRNWSMGMC